jgi:DNA polymerase-3 subunit epsilon
MMREIVLDTETTGLEPADGHRVVEIGAVELFNHVPTGSTPSPCRPSRSS